MMVECKNCGHYYSYIIEEIDIAKFYEEGVYEVVENRGSIFDRLLNIEGNIILDRISKFQNGVKGRLLDFGCGKGKFLFLAKENGWDVMGVETSLNRSNYAKDKYKIKVNTEYYAGGIIDNKQFDVITLFHVLEHIQNPNDLMNHLINENLEKGGIVVIEVPNIRSFQSKIANNKWLHLDIPRHLSHFNYDALYTILQKLGFSVIKKENFSIQHGVLGMLDSLLKIFGINKNIIIELKKKNINSRVLIPVIILLPFAFLLEIVCSVFNKGGIIRVYAKY